VIYFIEHAGRIKVGFADNVERRLKEFRTAIPSFVRLGSMEGTRGHERAIHQALAAYRLEGEWFKDCAFVRNFLTQAMIIGVEEVQPKIVSRHAPTMWDERAKHLCEIISAHRPKSSFNDIEDQLSIPRGTLWGIRYRPRREVSVGEYFALVTAARETIKRRRAELDHAEAFVSDLEREDAESTNKTVEVDRQMARYRVLLGKD
jgi:hypothetical protein